MHSLKNTFVAVLLLGASFGVYQAITTPDTSLHTDADLPAEISIDPGTARIGSGIGGNDNRLPPKLPDYDQKFADLGLPSQGSGTGGTAAAPNAFESNSAPASQPPMASQTWNSNPTTDQAVRQTGNLSPSDAPTNIELPGTMPADVSQPEDKALIDALKSQIQQSDNGFQPSGRAMASNGGMVPIGGMAPATTVGNSDVGGGLSQLQKGPDLTEQDLLGTWPSVQTLVDEGKFREALGSLSRFYNVQSITGPQRQRLMGWLNALAGIVIYSPEHNIYESPYVTLPNEQLTDISQKWGVTSELIYKINKKSIANPQALDSGTQLKVVQGPFHGQVDLKNQTLTLFLKNLYAGQFKVSLNSASSISPGVYQIARKTSSVATGTTQLLIELDGGIKIATDVGIAGPGVIAVSPNDGGDLFAILTEQSKIIVR